MISLSSTDREAEAQDYIVSVQMVDLEQSHEHSLKKLFELLLQSGILCYITSHGLWGTNSYRI